MIADRLRAAFAAGAGQLDQTEDDRVAGLPIEDFVPAAVLVPIIDAPEPRILLTVRHAGMRKHAGQVAFPGGRIDPGDADPIDAALREATEEIGLPRDRVDVIGAAAPYKTGTNYLITPVLGVIPDGLVMVPHEAEVSDIFEVPLAHVLAPANHLRKSAMWQGTERHFYEIPWEGYRIWGVTAALIVNLSRRLGPL
ncbi:MAG: coenzyme pyrophosphatase [Rhizorhabdus sp.]|nr:coenzyme pyrophosphatase [Rhizorhabdus sp.]